MTHIVTRYTHCIALVLIMLLQHRFVKVDGDVEVKQINGGRKKMQKEDGIEIRKLNERRNKMNKRDNTGGKDGKERESKGN